MTGPEERDVTARLAELEATVRGLTQELVSAEERIRQLETAIEDAEAEAAPATKVSPAEDEPEPETAEGEGIDHEDIIVA